uniref:RING-type domain-containing protein n=1 Tax=Sinocyclocheilus grahami TaxID=75366 RepID=A0A672KUX2_SINGR
KIEDSSSESSKKFVWSVFIRSDMAEANVSVGQDQFTCSVCLDLLKNPVTIPCGHSYCMNCITGWWNQENQRGLYKCPQCRKIFSPRPALCKNVVFDQLVENLKKTKLQTAVPAGASCQTPFDRHEEFCSNKPNKVMDTTGRQQQKICPQHNKQLEIYCRTDQLYICYLCAVNTHKTHNTVTAIDERTEKQVNTKMTIGYCCCYFLFIINGIKLWDRVLMTLQNGQILVHEC